MTRCLSLRCWTRSLAVAAVLSIAALAAAQPAARIVGPETNTPGNLVILRTESTGSGHKWAVIPEAAAANFLPILTADGQQAAVFSSSSPGTYVFVLAVADGGQVALATHTLNQGGVTPPGPDPPGPNPPGPDPPLPPVTAGKRTVLIVRESADSTPAVARMITALRQPPHATYLSEAGHKLSILDDDSVGPDGQPTPVLESWRPHFAGMVLPVVFIIDQTTGQLVHKMEIPVTATADQLMETVKAYD